MTAGVQGPFEIAHVGILLGVDPGVGEEHGELAAYGECGRVA